MTTGELIRILSHYIPDTEVSVFDTDDSIELDILDLVPSDDLDGAIAAEVVLTVRY